MQITLNLGRWTKLHTVVAVAMALVLAGVVGRAVAVGPTVDAPIRWAGGVPAVFVNGVTGVAILYTVPAGQNFMLTDLILSNYSNSSGSFGLFSGAGTGCAALSQNKLININVPANGTVVIPLVTGFGFTPGQRVCVSGSEATIIVNARGYLFTAAPAG